MRTGCDNGFVSGDSPDAHVKKTAGGGSENTGAQHKKRIRQHIHIHGSQILSGALDESPGGMQHEKPPTVKAKDKKTTDSRFLKNQTQDEVYHA